MSDADTDIDIALDAQVHFVELVIRESTVMVLREKSCPVSTLRHSSILYFADS